MSEKMEKRECNGYIKFSNSNMLDRTLRVREKAFGSFSSFLNPRLLYLTLFVCRVLSLNIAVHRDAASRCTMAVP